MGLRRRVHACIAAQPAGGQAGYAAVDALVALTILTSALVFAMGALDQARRGAASALEARQSAELLRYLLDEASNAPGVTHGSGRGFDWMVTVVEPVPTAGVSALCDVQVVATARGSKRVYPASSTKICPLESIP